MTEQCTEVFIPWLGPTLNEIWAGMHWSRRRKIAQAAHRACLFAKRVGRFEPPIRLQFIPHHGKGSRRLDCSNYAATAKALEDGLVAAGVLPGDSFSQVVGVETCAPVRSEQTGMLVRIYGRKVEQ